MVWHTIEHNDESSGSEDHVGESSFKKNIARIPRLFTPAGFLAFIKWMAYPAGRPLLGEIRDNVRSGITVSLVSVPLSISLAYAGGSTPVAGVVTAFWAGITAALIGGSHFNICGPTGALSGVLMLASHTYGMEVLPMLAVTAGLMALSVWALSIDRFIMYIPSSVVHGFTVGVAFIIAGGQLKGALGLIKRYLDHFTSDLTEIPTSPSPTPTPIWYSSPSPTPTPVIVSPTPTPHQAVPVCEEVKEVTFIGSFIDTLTRIPEAHIWTFVFFLVNATLLLTLAKKFPKIPWVIILTIIGAIIGYIVFEDHLETWLELEDFPLLTLRDVYPPEALTLSVVSTPHFKISWFLSSGFYSAAFTVAFIGILETLISARIADAMTQTQHNQQREVLGLALSNIVTGLVGGIPATAALARTALNVKTGATSRVSGVINSACVIIICLGLFEYFTYLPMSTIAAVLLMVAWRMIAFDHLHHMWLHDKSMFFISMITAIVCVIVDTSMGIVAGAILSLLIAADNESIGFADMRVTSSPTNTQILSVKKIDRHFKNQISNIGATEQEIELETNLNEKSIEEEDLQGSIVVYRIVGTLNFMNGSQHIQRIRNIMQNDSPVSHVVFSLSGCFSIDLDGSDALHDCIRIVEATGRTSYLCSVKNVKKIRHHGFVAKLEQEKRFFKSEDEALESLYATEPKTAQE